MEPEPYAFTILAATKVAAVSRIELYRAVARGELTLRKRGKRSLILADDLRRWVQSLPTADSSTKAA